MTDAVILRFDLMIWPGHRFICCVSGAQHGFAALVFRYPITILICSARVDAPPALCGSSAQASGAVAEVRYCSAF